MTNFETHIKYVDFRKKIYESALDQLKFENLHHVRENYLSMCQACSTGHQFKVKRTYGNFEEPKLMREIESVANEVADYVISYNVNSVGTNSNIECLLVDITQESSNYRLNVEFGFIIPNYNIECVNEFKRNQHLIFA